MNTVVIKHIGNFSFVTNKPVIFFQDNVIGLLTFCIQKDEESRPESARVFRVSSFPCEIMFYSFSPARGADITLRFICLLICIRTIARKYFPKFVAMPDRPTIVPLHCSVI